jgi:hypothetical protein
MAKASPNDRRDRSAAQGLEYSLAPMKKHERMSSASAVTGSTLALAAALLSGLACKDSNPAEPSDALFEILASAASGETFRIQVSDPSQIAALESLLGQGNRKIVSGALRRGNGGFNTPWSWHMAPDSIEVADVTIELCDGRPSDVESALDYWIDTVGRFCPWGTEVVARLQ